MAEVDWTADDDATLHQFVWTVAGRALVEWPGGGLANGLLLRSGSHVQVVVIWERPNDGGLGRFRCLPVGDWTPTKQP